MQKLVIIFSIALLSAGCVTKRPITLQDNAKIGVYASYQDITINNIWNKDTARRDKQKDILIEVEWGLKDKIENALLKKAQQKWPLKITKIKHINANLGPSDAISYGFSSVYEHFIPAFKEVKDKNGIEVLILAKPAWRYYHAETPLYNKGIGIQSFQDGLSGHVGVDIFAIDLHTMTIIFPASQDGITMEPFIKNFDLTKIHAEVNRQTEQVVIHPAYKEKVFLEIDKITNWFINEVPISLAK